MVSLKNRCIQNCQNCPEGRENKLKRVSKADSLCTFSNDFAKSTKHLQQALIKNKRKIRRPRPGYRKFENGHTVAGDRSGYHDVQK